uniref:Uncharacterized protein TCIL3000_10_4080 n=1 Tax=Trypanosoma congolense (strain IL3000) TaxID=1068625 RepID=G0UW79_TRYCI|nr:unnamed protein product [Trypanosoma congolense IL3000]
MPPRFRLCPLCQQGFGTASLGIHVPQCYQKALKRWMVNPVGPKPVMPNADLTPRKGRAYDTETVACGRGTNGARTLCEDEQFVNIPEHAENMNLHPCSRCGRKFLFDRIAYHESVCKGNVKRKVFDSSKQRAIDGQHRGSCFGSSTSGKWRKTTSGASTSAPGVPRTRWREQHLEFIEAMRAARRANQASKAMWGESSVRESQSTRPRQQRASPGVLRQQRGANLRQQRTANPMGITLSGTGSTSLSSYSRQSRGNAYVGRSDRFSSNGGGGGGGGGGQMKIINDNTTSLGMLQAFGRA